MREEKEGEIEEKLKVVLLALSLLFLLLLALLREKEEKGTLVEGKLEEKFGGKGMGEEKGGKGTGCVLFDGKGFGCVVPDGGTVAFRVTLELFVGAERFLDFFSND